MTTMLSANPAQRRSRLHLILIALLFAAPVISAWVAWKLAVTEGVGSTTNAGTLVQPARPLTAVPMNDAAGVPLAKDLLHGRWSYVMLAGDGCDKHCVERLHLTRQLRISVNKDQTRVQRVLVVKAVPPNLTQLQADNPDLVIAVATGKAWTAFSEQFAAVTQAAVYLVDPLGNLMMSYPASVHFKGMLLDLRKLLKVSQIG
jgi:hypothetical protein